MKSTVIYLDLVKQRFSLSTDYKLAKWLGSDTAVISNYRLKKRVIDPYTAARIAEALGIDPMEVIATAEMEREKDEKKRDFWRKLLHKLEGTGLCIMLATVSVQRLEFVQYLRELSLCAVGSSRRKLERTIQKNHQESPKIATRPA